MECCCSSPQGGWRGILGWEMALGLGTGGGALETCRDRHGATDGPALKQRIK